MTGEIIALGILAVLAFLALIALAIWAFVFWILMIIDCATNKKHFSILSFNY